MTTLMQASSQWASRPSDQRFLSLTEMHAYQTAVREASRSKIVSNRQLSAQPIEEDRTHKMLTVVGPNGGPVLLTHWSFGQLSSLAGCPAGYLRTLPAPLAADCINYGLECVREVEDVGVLLQRHENGPSVMRAVTGPNYGRIWDAEITAALISRFGDGVTGDFRVPGEWGKQVAVTRDNTTLYASDRDMFVFLADEKHRIEIPNRRNGKSGSLARGFFVWNSEVGKNKFGVATFMFDFVCGNRIVWGAENYKEISIRHTASAPVKFLEEITPALQRYANSATTSITQAIEKARQSRIDDVDEFLKRRKFSTKVAGAIKAAHLSDEQRPIETLWDATTAVTAYARGISYQDERVDLEREGGRILELAA